MSYTKRTIVKGSVMETKKMLSAHVHSQKGKKSKSRSKPQKAQTKVVGQNAEEKLRWLLNENFSRGNLYVTLCYCNKN